MSKFMFALLALFSMNLYAAETVTTIGGLFSAGGAMSVYVRDSGGVRSIEVAVIDKRAVNRVFFKLTDAEVIKLQSMLAEAQAEVVK